MFSMPTDIVGGVCESACLDSGTLQAIDERLRQLILFSEATRSCGLDSVIYGFVLLTYWL